MPKEKTQNSINIRYAELAPKTFGFYFQNFGISSILTESLESLPIYDAKDMPCDFNRITKR